jgi:hypothetical protein
VRTNLVVRTAVAGALTVLIAACGGNSGSGPGSVAAPPKSTTATAPASTAPADNGIGELPMTQVLSKARAALAAAKTVAVVADVGAGAERSIINARVQGNQGASGTVRFGAATMSFLRLGGTVYLRADAANWRAFGAGEGADLLADKYVIMPGGGKDLGPLVEFTSMKGLASYFATPPGTPDIALKWPTATIRGLRAIRIGELSEGAIFVAAVGQPYPLRIQSTNPKERSLIDLADFNKPVPLAKPPASQVITLPNE